MQTANQTHCACGAAFPIHPIGYCGGSGYAITRDSVKICYSCADKAQIEELKDRSKPFGAYVSGDGRAITSWTGGHLMRITRSRSCRLTRLSHTHDKGSYMSVHCVDVHGGHWHGRGSAGICITLRACNS